MKKINILLNSTLVVLILLASLSAFAQQQKSVLQNGGTSGSGKTTPSVFRPTPPQTTAVTNKMNYQAVARNVGGGILANTLIGLRLTIEDGSGGSTLYEERQTPTTNAFGLFTVQIGGGSLLSGNYNTINWANGNQWLKVGMDVAGGTNYTDMGESQLLSVPYANFALASGDNHWTANGNNIYNANSANVGVGTIAPTHKFEVAQNANSIAINSGNATLYNNGQVSNGNALYLESNETGDNTGGVPFSMAQLSGYNNNTPFGAVNAGVWGTVTGNGSPGYGVMASYGSLDNAPTTYAGLAGDVYSGIFMGGKVGIGTTAPATSLEVSGSGIQTARLTSTDASDVGLEFVRPGGAYYDYKIYDQSGTLFFNYDDVDFSGGNGTNVMMIGTGTVSCGGYPGYSARFSSEAGPFSIGSVGSSASNNPGTNVTATYGGSFNEVLGVYGKTSGANSSGISYGAVAENTTGSGTSYTIGALASAIGLGAYQNYGLYGHAVGAASGDYGVYGEAYGTGVNYGICGTASNGTTNYAGYFSGNVYATGTITSSDAKLKRDIQPLTGALSTIMQLRPTTYLYKNDEYKSMNLPSVKQFGLIAQEVEQVLPSIVSENVQPGNSGVSSEKAEAIHFKGLNYTQLIPVLISAMQEQQKEIEALKTEIKTLKK